MTPVVSPKTNASSVTGLLFITITAVLPLWLKRGLITAHPRMTATDSRWILLSFLPSLTIHSMTEPAKEISAVTGFILNIAITLTAVK